MYHFTEEGGIDRKIAGVCFNDYSLDGSQGVNEPLTGVGAEDQKQGDDHSHHGDQGLSSHEEKQKKGETFRNNLWQLTNARFPH